MPVPYKVVVKRPGGIGSQIKHMYYPTVTNTKMIDLNHLCDIISERSARSRADIHYVAELLANTIPKLLQDGNSVKFGNLGIFSLSIKGEGKESAKDVNVRAINEVKINFRPSTVVKRKLKNTDFRKTK